VNIFPMKDFLALSLMEDIWCRIILPQSAICFMQKARNVGLISVFILVSEQVFFFSFCVCFKSFNWLSTAGAIL
jgi:hypothetical protein